MRVDGFPARAFHEDISVTGDGASFPPRATFCHKCNAKALVIMERCSACLSCRYSKCGWSPKCSQCPRAASKRSPGKRSAPGSLHPGTASSPGAAFEIRVGFTYSNLELHLPPFFDSSR